MKGNGNGTYHRVPSDDDQLGNYDEEDTFLSRQQRKHQQLISQQDQDLGALGESVQRLGQLSLNIHHELGAQNE